MDENVVFLKTDKDFYSAIKEHRGLFCVNNAMREKYGEDYFGSHGNKNYVFSGELRAKRSSNRQRGAVV